MVQVYQWQQMALLNWQVHQQQQLAQWHANLHQVLHETEGTSRRVAATAPLDPFAAAVLSRAWIQRVGSIGAGHFPDIVAKRAWSDSLAILMRHASPQKAAVARKVDLYFDRMNRLSEYQRHMAAEPDVYLGRVHNTYARTGDGTIWIGAVVVAALLSLLAFIGGSGGAGVFCLLLGGVAFYPLFMARAQKQKAANDLAAAQRYVAAYREFLAHPEGGVWLNAAWNEHRLLFEHPPEAPPSSAQAMGGGAVSIERIERQIVVVRCKYCQQLTPVDRSSCEHCGAAGFGSK
jgi:hypothetical protein